MLSAATCLVDAHETLWEENHRVLEMRGVVIGGPHVHEEGRAGGNGGAVVGDVLNGFSCEGHVQGRPVAKDFFDKGSHVFAGFVGEAAAPGVGVWGRLL